LSESLSPAFLTISDSYNGITIEELRNFRKVLDELPLNTEANPSTTQEDEHSLIEGLRVIYG
jgi:hypothetical protein